MAGLSLPACRQPIAVYDNIPDSELSDLAGTMPQIPHPHLNPVSVVEAANAIGYVGGLLAVWIYRGSLCICGLSALIVITGTDLSHTMIP